MDAPTPKRRRILVTEILIDRAGQYVAQPIRLPANARRVTGVLVTTQQAGGLVHQDTGWVIYGAPGQVPGAVLERWYDAVRYNRLPGGIRPLPGDMQDPEGFQLVLSDDVALALLRPAADQATYVFLPQGLGVAVFNDALGHPVSFVAPAPRVAAQANGEPDIMVYELPVGVRVYFPPTFTPA